MPTTICTVLIPTSDFPGPCGRELPCSIHSPEASVDAGLLDSLTDVPHGHTLLLAAWRSARYEVALDSLSESVRAAVVPTTQMGLVEKCGSLATGPCVRLTETGAALMRRWHGEGA